MSSKNFKFSIITVTKNAEKLIEETASSVCEQSILNDPNLNIQFQYIFVDGDSNDRTNQIIKKIIDKYSHKKNINFKHIIESDDGLYDGLRKGLEIVEGDITAYINAGDFYYPKCFEIVHSIFSDNPKINWITGGKFIYNKLSQIISFSTPYKYRKELIRSGFYGKYLPFIQQESTFWRTKLNNELDINQLKKLKLSGDLFLWHCFSKKNDIYIVNSYLSGFKYHENQLTFKSGESTKEYLNESKKFNKRKKLYYFFLFLIDLPFWAILRYSSNLAFITNKNQFNFDLKENSWVSKISKSIKNKLIYCWACDFNLNRGEGILAYKFIKNLNYMDYNLMIKTPRKDEDYFFSKDDNSINIKKLNKMNFNFFEKYFTPFVGVLLLNYYNFKNQKTCYLNFLPLWNFLLFLFLPKKTVLGPITGSLYYGKVISIETFVRKFIMPILFKFSLKIIDLRGLKLIFATENLKSFVEKNSIRRQSYNIAFIKEEIVKPSDSFVNKFANRKYDFCIYYRRYSTKSNEFQIQMMNELSKNYKIVVIGDNPNLHNKIEFLGLKNRKEVEKILSETKYTIASGENFMSLFVYDCLTCGVKVFFNEDNIVPEVFSSSNSIVPLNYFDYESSKKIIYNKLTQKKFVENYSDFTTSSFDLDADNYFKTIDL